MRTHTLVSLLLFFSPLQAQEIPTLADEHLRAFGHLSGVVRYFHPADQSVDLDWDRFVIENMDRVQAASSPAKLAATLQQLFAHFAPTVQVWEGAPANPPPPVKLPAESPTPTRYVGIHHVGIGPVILKIGQDAPPQRNIYASEVVAVALDAEHDERLPACDSEYLAQLPGGISCRIPLTVMADAGGTLPRGTEADYLMANRPQEWQADVNRRATRFAGIFTVYNLMMHFYPYWDVVDTDWEATFAEALRKAAAPQDEGGFLETLRWFVAQIKDGHGNVYHNSFRMSHQLPAVFELVGEEIVVTHVGEGCKELAKGDRLIAMDGRPADALFREFADQICAATEGWRRSKAMGDFLYGDSTGPVKLRVAGADGAERNITVERTTMTGNQRLMAPRPENGSEVAPGIRYFDLHRTSEEELNKHMETLAAAQGIVFDMRGYPGSAGVALLPHLSDEVIHSAWWNIPEYRFPRQRDVKFQRSHWTLEPQSPRLPKNIAFLTDGRAISYAESCMGIVEHYKLGEIVGARTAGTNGNINRMPIPGGYIVIWTGMKVTKHDDSQHHGVGILPTVAATPTRAGIASDRDEVLERGIDVLQKKLKR